MHDRDHGGRRGGGEGAALGAAGAGRARAVRDGYRLLLLTQPRWFGTVFNPVSFWLALRGEALVAVIAEVNNTYGDRHSYLCAKPGFAPIGPGDVLTARKGLPRLAVPGRSPAATPSASTSAATAIAIRIAHRNGGEGLVATLDGPRRPLTAPGLLRAALRFPFAGAPRHRAHPLAGAAPAAEGRAVPAAAAAARRGHHP